MPEVRVLSWDHRERMPFTGLSRVLDDLGGGRIHSYDVDTDSDEYAVVFSTAPMTQAEANEAYLRTVYADDDPIREANRG